MVRTTLSPVKHFQLKPSELYWFLLKNGQNYIVTNLRPCVKFMTQLLVGKSRMVGPFFRATNAHTNISSRINFNMWEWESCYIMLCKLCIICAYCISLIPVHVWLMFNESAQWPSRFGINSAKKEGPFPGRRAAEKTAAWMDRKCAGWMCFISMESMECSVS